MCEGSGSRRKCRGPGASAQKPPRHRDSGGICERVHVATQFSCPDRPQAKACGGPGRAGRGQAGPERRALFGCFIILLGATLISATAMHLVEQHAQPDKFGTIPDAMWWAIVTLGTIGYGDVVPATTLGRLVAGVTIFGGLIMIALPVGIIATAFADEIHRRDFMVTWGMVARVPLFAELNAGEIADIMRLMRAQTVEPGDLIVRRGEVA